MFYYSYNIGSQWQSAETCYADISGGGINLGYFAGAPIPAGVNPPFAGFFAVINLKTGVLMAKDAVGDYLEYAEMVNLVKEANQ